MSFFHILVKLLSETWGVILKLQEFDRVYNVSDKGADILSCLHLLLRKLFARRKESFCN